MPRGTLRVADGRSMKLISWPTSPFARKARIVLHELDLPCEIVDDHPLAPNTRVTDHNPLGKIPALVTDDRTLVDSPVICAYLDTLSDRVKLHPSGEDGWAALQLQALGDGLMDASVLRRLESLRPDGERSPYWIARYEQAIHRTLDRLTPFLDDGLTIGTITAACALGYIDFRYAELDWRKDHPSLAAWFADWEQRPAMVATAPPR